MHCLSSSGRRDPRELTTSEAKAVIDELRADAGLLRQHRRRRAHDPPRLLGAARLRHRPPRRREVLHQRRPHHPRGGRAGWPRSDYVDVQISLDGATAEVNDAVRGAGSYATALRAMEHLAAAGFEDFKISVVCTRHNVAQLDEFKALADRYGAQLRLTRLRPSGRGADVWDELHPTQEQQRQLYDWLLAHGEDVLTGDSFFHLAAFGEPLPGLNLCGAGRVVCLIDPVGDVYACPFAIHDEFLAGNVRDRRRLRRGLAGVRAVPRAARAADRRRLRVLRGLRRLPGRLHGRQVLHRAAARRPRPRVRPGLRRGSLLAERPADRCPPAAPLPGPLPATAGGPAAAGPPRGPGTPSRQRLRREPARPAAARPDSVTPAREESDAWHRTPGSSRSPRRSGGPGSACPAVGLRRPGRRLRARP